MPITGINWDKYKNAMVVHVIAGTTSPDLRVKHLRFQIPAEERTGTRTHEEVDHDYPFAKSYLDDPAHGNDVTLTFTIADASAAPGTSTRSFASRGITLNANTGEITVAATLTAPFPANFLLEVQAVSGTNTFKELIRVEVHRGIQRIWLTPDVLKVRARPGPTLSKFAVRALFDDDVVGDITEFFSINWSPARNVSVDGRLIVVAGDTGAAPITITASLPGFPSVAPATGRLQAVEPWGHATPIETRLVPGGGWPNPFALEAVPNVLFLSDGFPREWREDFYRYVNALVQFLKTDPVCKPYDLLADSINFWAAFVESDQAGVTWGSELVAFIGGSLMPLPPPQRPQSFMGESWGIVHLIYEVGLPLPSDAPSNTARTNAAILAEWDTLFGSTFRAHLSTDAARLDATVNDWRSLAGRTILDDIDSPLGTRSGAPRIDGENDMLRMNRDRTDRGRLDDLMSALRHDQAATSGLDLSTLWVNRITRNYDLVCIIVPNDGRAANYDGYFYVNPSTVRTFTGTGVSTVLDPPTFSATPGPSETRLFAHEFSHSFSLGDEYGGSESSRMTQPTVDRADRAYPDLQSPHSLQRSGRIHGDEIKWRWPRIRWAAELIGPITSSASGVFEAPIRASHAFAVPVGEIVHLRFRNIDFAYRDVRFVEDGAHLAKLPKVSVPLRLVETFETGSPPVVNVRLRLDASASFPYPAANTVPPADFVAEFPTGSIVYAPTRAPDVAYDATTYPYAEVIAKNIREYVTHRVSIGQPGALATGEDFPQVPDYSGFTFPHCFPTAQYPLVVALYEGGLGNNTGIFHPTGDCMMSDQDSGSQFCHVCKYMLVDAIDPGKHYFLDREYERFYPQR